MVPPIHHISVVFSNGEFLTVYPSTEQYNKIVAALNHSDMHVENVRFTDDDLVYDEMDDDELDAEFERWNRMSDTIAEEDLVEASPFPVDRISEEKSAFTGIPTEEPVAVPANVIKEIQEEVNSSEGLKIESFDPGADEEARWPLTFDTVQQASEFEGIPVGEINRVLRGQRKTTHGLGFRYKTVDISNIPSSELHQEHGTLKGGLPHTK